VAASPVVVAKGEEIKRGGGRFHIGNPYKIAGRWFAPEDNPQYDEVGLASWYGDAFHGRLTANGEVFDSGSLSAAHPTLPLPTYVRVTNLENDRSVIVRVNDRGPFAHSRLIDVSEKTAELLGFKRAGTAKVRVQYVDRARLDGDDEAFLMASYEERDGTGRAATMLAMASEPVAPVPPAVAEAPAAASAGPAVAFAGTAGPEPARQAVSLLTVGYSPEDRIAMTFGLLGD
jgi:rare lipoprotein A